MILKTEINQRAARLLHLSDPDLQAGDPLRAPIVSASAYHLPGAPRGDFQYGRWSNPTWQDLERAIELLEAAPTVVFPSGMAAIASVLCTSVQPGEKILLASDGYYTSRALVDRYLAPRGIEVVYCPTSRMCQQDIEHIDLVLVETPSNPILSLCDIEELSHTCSAVNALLVVDNSAMTPIGQNPLRLGADVVVSSDTKALNGHSDVIFGHVSTKNEDVYQRCREWRTTFGAIPGPYEASLVRRGLDTLEIRYDRMSRSAASIAKRLEESQTNMSVTYPGLPSHPAHELAKRQMNGFGYLIGLTFADAASADHFIESAEMVTPMTSFGGVHSSAERRSRWGDDVAPGYVRLSVGCEPLEPLWESIELAALG
ncbi:cystathionine gamma-lyase [uncultured Litoreibacter sp.]|uniref:cystathionine gamma-lyase n=1 Tax=uncultured Litoreibacter sp. TaxID=1392394 RepID=UPI00262ABF86|nr:cystathionine gamma-lyase [uncultured Litoreibacter sp.]